MKALALRPNVAAVAKRLAEGPLRIWHDQILIKPPGHSKPTAFHYDEAYHPHTNSSHLISAWTALCDVPVDKGCMSFVPGSHARRDLPPQPQNLRDPRSLFSACPELEWKPRVTVPLKAGDCTFHHGRCAHMAVPNLTDEPRVAHVVIFMDAETRLNGSDHIVSRSLGRKEWDLLKGDLFPLV